MSSTALSTGLGSLPGESAAEAVAVATDNSPEIVFLPELPSRGPGGEMIGRTFALLNELDDSLSIETTPSGWRLSRGDNRIMRRGRSWYHEDLDELEKVAGSSATRMKFQFAGPITLAAFIEPVFGERVIQDLGAVRDINAALIEVVRGEVQEFRRRFPNASIAIQIDEPGLELALRGGLKRRSGRGNLEPIAADITSDLLKLLATEVRELGVETWLHTCATNPPLGLIQKTRFQNWALPFNSIRAESNFEAIANHWDNDGILVVGISSEILAAKSLPKGIIADVNRFAEQIGLPLKDMPSRIVISPECGLAYSANPVLELQNASKIAASLEWQD